MRCFRSAGSVLKPEGFSGRPGTGAVGPVTTEGVATTNADTGALFLPMQLPMVFLSLDAGLGSNQISDQ